MKKRITALVLACVLLTAMLPGCNTEDTPYVPTGDGLTWDDGSLDSAQEATEPEAEMDLVMMYYPDITMNPFTCTDYTNQTLFSLLYQGLFTADSEYNVTPILCGDFFVSENMKNYIFYLDEKATFSDGTPVTIMDVYASYVAAKESKVYAGRFFHVREFTVTEDGGLSISLSTAFENLPLLLDIPLVKESDIMVDRPVGSGPYYMEQTAFSTRLRRVRNWWCGENATLIVDASAITLREAESNTQIRDSFEFSDVGLVRANPGSDAYADYRCDYELWDCENGEFLYIACNLKSEVFSNASIRRALTYAVDREMIVEEYYQGFAHAASLPASPQFPGYDEKLAARYTFDSEKFADAVRNAGKMDAEIRLLVNKKDSLRLRVAREIAAELEKCGLTVQLSAVGPVTYQHYLNVQEYDLYISETRLPPNMDLSAFFSTRGELRKGNLADTTFYAMCQEALANVGNFYNLHELVMEDGRVCPILFSTYSVHATRGLLTGLTPSRDNVFYYSIGKTVEDIATYEEPEEEA